MFLNRGASLKTLTLIIVGAVVLSFGFEASAQSADPYDPNSPNYIGNKAKIKRPKWNSTISSSLFRSRDAASETGLYYQGVVGYYFNKKLRGDVTLGYSHSTDLVVANPDRWEFEDISLRLVRPNVWKSKNEKWSSTLIGRFDLPTSGTSQNASQYGRLRTSLQTVTRRGKFTFALVPTLTLAWHEFETRDRDGFIRNSPLALTFAGTARYGVTRRLGVVAAVGYTGVFDYDFNTVNVQVLSASVQYLINKKLFTSVGYRWRDRVLTNNSLFDDDASQLSLSIGYTL